MRVEAHESEAVARVEAASYGALFRVPGFAQIAAGTVLARTAAQLWQIALVLFVLQRFRSPALAGEALFLAVVPGLVISPIAGALLDRHGRLRLILVDYTIAAITLVLLAALALPGLLSQWLLLVIVAVGSLTGPLSGSGTRALFPLVVPRELWDRANAVDSGSYAVAMVIGPALAGLLVGWVGGEGAFLLTAGVFVAAGLALIGVREPLTEPLAREPLFWSAWRSLVYVVRNASLRGLVVSLWMTNIPFGIMAVALPVLALRAYHWGASGVGAMWALSGVASIIAGLFVGRINTEGRERAILAASMALGALGCLLTVAVSPFVLLAGVTLFGLSAAPADIALFALRQRRTDPRWFGRVFAVSMSLNYLGIPVGSLLGGNLVSHSVPLALVVAASVAVAGCAVPFLTIPQRAGQIAPVG